MFAPANSFERIRSWCSAHGFGGECMCLPCAACDATGPAVRSSNTNVLFTFGREVGSTTVIKAVLLAHDVCPSHSLGEEECHVTSPEFRGRSDVEAAVRMKYVAR